MARLRRVLGDVLTDGLTVVGAGLVAYGAWLMFAPVGYVVAGLALIGWGIVRGLYERAG